MPHVVNSESLAQYAFACRSDFFRYPLTTQVAHGGDDLDALEAEFVETETCCLQCRRCRHALSGARRAYPVTKVGEEVDRIDLVDPDCAEKLAAVPIRRDKIKGTLFIPGGHA